ncbi:DUF5702 domain-containing protein [Clostridium sp. HBUAS56017]|uniref:DUF5702 domain-containing protein n=1 Tax=Clostridium sp. HBUAS56017 TaxID=2571128 RepID=UPI0011781649|nr:DUF5702 domain-containing protein [Clostridium sp. HBUAS56017]
MKNSKGSITIYLSLIIVIIIVFIGGLVDGSRMRTADTQVNRAVDNGTKSVLASYNRDLKDKYGLFAYSGDESSMQDTVTSVTKDNLLSPGDGYVDLYDYKLDALNINMKGPLTQPEVIKEQILQNMKYRAPINLMENIIQKLSLFKDMNKYSDVLKKKEKLDQKVKDIDKKLKSVDEQGKKIQDLIKKIKQYDNEDNRKDVTYQFSDIKAFLHLSMILDAVEKYEDKKQEENPKYEPINLSNLRSIINKGKKDCSKQIEEDVKQLKEALDEFLKDSKVAKEAVDNARDVYEQYKSSLENTETSANKGTMTNNGLGDSVDAINEGFQMEAETYDAIFGDKNNLDENIKRAKNNKEAIEEIQKQMENYDKFRGSDYNEHEVDGNVIGEIKQLSRKNDYASVIDFYNSKNSMRDTKRRLDIPSELTDIQDTISSSVDKLQELLETPPQEKPEDATGRKQKAGEDLKDKKEESVDNDPNLSEKSIAQYSSVLPSKNINTKDFIKFDKNRDSAISGDGNSNIERSLDAMDVLAGLENALDSIRDKVYLNEYVMTRLKDRVVGESPELAKNRVPKMVDFDTQLDYEIEYILAGNLDDKSNSDNVWWKIYACRVLANAISIRGITDCMQKIQDMALLTQATLAIFGIPSNLTFLKAIYAAGWVAAESKSDLDLLVKGHKVPLYKRDFDHWATQNVLTVESSVVETFDNPKETSDKLLSTIYSDYLRLFLLLQSQETTLARTEDMIQVNMKKGNEDFDLSKAMTQINVTGTASIKYMFFNLPMMFEENRKSGRYEINIKKSLSF